jgi:hypothetical protein
MKEREVVCFGAGRWLEVLSEQFQYGTEKTFDCAVDSNPALWGVEKNICETVLKVFPPKYPYENATEKTVVLIINADYAVTYDLPGAVAGIKKCGMLWPLHPHRRGVRFGGD